MSKGIALGRPLDAGKDAWLHAEGRGPVVSFMPPASTYGFDLVTSNLRNHPGSIVVLDPDGAYYAATAESRVSTGAGY